MTNPSAKSRRDGPYCAAHACIVRRQKTDLRQQQQAGIELFGPVGLHEAPKLGVETAPADVGMNGGGDLAPAIDRAFETELLRTLDGAIEGYPGQHLGIGEVPARAAHFPDSFVRLGPDALEVGEKRLLQGPTG